MPSGYALKEDAGIDEELRLLYVAITRAEDNLFITYPVLQYRRHQGEFLSNPSRFVEGIPEKLLEPWSLIEDAAVQATETPPLIEDAGESESDEEDPELPVLPF